MMIVTATQNLSIQSETITIILVFITLLKKERRVLQCKLDQLLLLAEGININLYMALILQKFDSKSNRYYLLFIYSEEDITY